MASKQRLKKEIDYVVSDLILDCYTFSSMQQKQNDEDVLHIIQDTLVLRNELREKINHPEKRGESETAKNYYDKIAKTLLDRVEEGYEKLGKLTNPKS